MPSKDKRKPAATIEPGDRQREIERLEKDVEELRHLANTAGAEAELERIRQQVSELQHEFYAHLGAWQAQIALIRSVLIRRTTLGCCSPVRGVAW